MPTRPRHIFSIHWIAALLLIGAVAGVSCKSAKNKPAQDNADLSQAVAKVDDTVITVGDVQERINKQSPFIRARYTTVDKKKEFLDNLIRFEVMAKEAQKRGYDKDPEVIRVMKQQMISKFLQKDFESKLKVEDVPDAEVEKYYNAHPEEFNQKDQVRVSQILVKDKAKADKIAAEARALPKEVGADQKAFGDMVTKYSEDEDSKPRRGDLTFFDKDTTQVPKPIVEASFAMKEVGDVTGPIKTDKGFHVLKLTQKRPGFSRPLPEVKRQIQQRLFRDLRTKALDDFYAEMKKKAKIDVHEDKLAKVLIDSGMGNERPPGMEHAVPSPPQPAINVPPPPRKSTPPPARTPETKTTP